MSGAPVRILHVVAGMNRGGIETWLMSVLRHIDRKLYQMDFLVHTSDKCVYDDEIRALGAQVIPCLHPSKPWEYAKSFDRIINEYGPFDVIHSHTYWFSGFVVWLAYRKGIIQRIAHFYPYDDKKTKNPARTVYKMFMMRWLKKYATGILADSKAALDTFNEKCRCPTDRKAVIYPVVDLSPFYKEVDRKLICAKYDLPNDIPIVLYVARFYPHKNHSGLVNILSQVNSNESIAHFAMAGASGPSLTEIEQIVCNRSDVSLFTDLQDISELMLASDLFVFPSLNEGFGIVALEAQAAGLPVLATNLPSVREVLAPGLKPLMFDPGDLDRAVVLIKSLLSNNVQLKQLGQEARIWSHRFSKEASIEQLVNFYKQGAGH